MVDDWRWRYPVMTINGKPQIPTTQELAVHLQLPGLIDQQSDPATAARHDATGPGFEWYRWYRWCKVDGWIEYSA